MSKINLFYSASNENHFIVSIYAYKFPWLASI